MHTWGLHHTPKVTQYFVLSSDTGQRDEDRKGKHLTLTSAAKIKSNSGMTREFVSGLRKVAPATFAHSHTFPRSPAEALADAHLHECQNCSISPWVSFNTLAAFSPIAQHSKIVRSVDHDHLYPLPKTVANEEIWKH